MYGAYVEVAAYSQVLEAAGNAEGSSKLTNGENYSWLLPFSDDGTSIQDIAVPPWTLAAADGKYGDFILVSEVSEIEGPRPLFTVPADLNANVQLDKLTERMMSVDYQTCASGPFVISDDTQALLPNVWEQLHAYVHYFTLNDMHARGFVRPMCIAYLSCDRRKLSVNVQTLRQKLLEVTKFLKFGNRKLFLQDMEQYLVDLQKSKDDYVEKCKANSSESKLEDSFGDTPQPKSATLDVFAMSITEVQQLLSGDKPLLDNPHLENTLEFVKWQVKHQLVDLYWLIKRYVARKSNSRPKLIDPKQHHFMTEMKNLCELCSWGLIVGLALLVKVHEFFMMDYISIYMDKQDALLLDPPAGTLTVGGNIVTNLLPATNMSRAFTLDSASQEMPDYYCQQIQEYRPQIKAILDVIIPPSFQRVVEDVAHTATTNREAIATAGGPCAQFLNVDSPNLESSPNESLGTECTFYGMSDITSESVDCESFHSITDLIDERDTQPNAPCESDSCDGENYEDACGSAIGTSITSLSPVKSLATRIYRLAPDKAGYSIVTVMQKFQCLPHILYSLLIGRPVIVVGTISSQEEICSVVKALCLFIPEKKCEGVIIPWCITPIRLPDICKLKLIGVGVPDRKIQNSIITNCIKNYVTVLDIDKMTFQGPIYTGTFLLPLINAMRFYWEDGPLISFIYSILQTISRKVNIYYQCICLNEQLTYSDDVSTLQSRKMPDMLLSGLKLDGNDIIIIKHMTEGVKSAQVAMTLKMKLGCNETTQPRMLRVSHEKVVTIKLGHLAPNEPGLSPHHLRM